MTGHRLQGPLEKLIREAVLLLIESGSLHIPNHPDFVAAHASGSPHPNRYPFEFPFDDELADNAQGVDLSAEDFVDKLWLLAITLLLIMISGENLIEPGRLEKKRKLTSGEGKPMEFWSPNFLGRLYQSTLETEAGNRSVQTQRLAIWTPVKLTAENAVIRLLSVFLVLLASLTAHVRITTDFVTVPGISRERKKPAPGTPALSVAPGTGVLASAIASAEGRSRLPAQTRLP